MMASVSVTEQQFEAVHHNFTTSWDRYKVGKDHKGFGDALLNCIMSYDAKKT